MKKIKEEICNIGKRLYERGFVASHDGNISVRTEKGILVTPTLTSKGFMNVDDIVLIDYCNNILEGSKKQSSEAKLHIEVYKNRPDIMAIVHSHSPFACAFAINRKPVNQRYMPEAINSLGVIPVAEYAEPSTEKLAKSIEPFVKNHNGVLLANHGSVTWAKTLLDAYNLTEQLEFYCKTVIFADILGNPISI